MKFLCKLFGYHKWKYSPIIKQIRRRECSRCGEVQIKHISTTKAWSLEEWWADE